MKSNYHVYWMSWAQTVARNSRDISRQTGAIILSRDDTILGLSCNGFPNGVDSCVKERHQRPAKYLWTECSERNAAFQAARKGCKLLGSRIYVNWYPCAGCARAIIQCGITNVFAIEPDWNDPRYGAEFRMVREMFDEVGMPVTFLPGEAPKQKVII